MAASNLPVLEAARRRWGIESAFSQLKPRGLDLEAHHTKISERISRLFELRCGALAWMAQVGAQTVQGSPPRQNNRGRAVVSQVRIGRQVLAQAARWRGERLWICLELINTTFPLTHTSITRGVRY